eukprot:tig00000912_g5451.t1
MISHPLETCSPAREPAAGEKEGSQLQPRDSGIGAAGVAAVNAGGRKACGAEQMAAAVPGEAAGSSSEADPRRAAGVPRRQAAPPRRARSGARLRCDPRF